MITKIILHENRQEMHVKTCKEKNLVIHGGQNMLAAELVERHNQSPHAHPNLWYIHEQGEAAELWTVTHNLNRHPSVTIVDSGDNVVIGYVTYLDNNNFEVKCNGAYKGKAYLN